MHASRAAMRNSPITPPPARFTCPRGPAVSFDVREAINRQDDATLPSYTAEQLAFYKDAVVQLKQRMASSDREFIAMSQQFRSQLKMQVGLLSRNQRKNRYVNVIPYDDTRVKLDLRDASGTLSDYINASFVVDPIHDNVPVFIATQAPISSTLTDFWHMIFQQKCSAIVMLTKLLDDYEERCASYYPIALNQSQLFGQLRVTNTFTDCLRDNRTIRRIFEVQDLSDSNSASHSVMHLQFHDWPDFGVPSSSASVREMVRTLQCIPANAGPFVVHCSAGIGRTGTFCAICHTIERILHGDITAVDVGQTVIQFRSQRSGMVQKKEQFRFIYEAVVDELKEIIESQCP